MVVYIKDCRRCGMKFSGCEAWLEHIRSCYTKKSRRPVHNTSIRVSITTNNPTAFSVLLAAVADAVEEDDNKNNSNCSASSRVNDVDLMVYLPSWPVKRKRGTYGGDLTPGLSSSPSTCSVSVSAIEDQENKEGSELGFLPNKKQVLMLPESSPDSDVGLKLLAMVCLEDDQAQKVGDGHGATLNNEVEKCGSSTVEAVVKYECKECGQEFSDFRGLGGHVSNHNRKRRMQEATVGGDEVDGLQQSKVKNGINGGRGGDGDHQCDQCGKRFPTGQALGGHKRVHWDRFSITKRFDLNLLPPVARFVKA